MGLAVAFHDERRSFHERCRPTDFSVRNALAKKIRREYPHKPVDALRAEYGLTEGEARNVVYGYASLRSLEKIINAGGLGLAIELWADALGDRLESYLERQAEEARRAEARSQANTRAAEALVSLAARRAGASTPIDGEGAP